LNLLRAQISESEITTAIKLMKNKKAPGPSDITSEMMKALDEDGIDWLYIILNNFLQQDKLPDDMKESEIVTIYKQKAM